MVISLIQHGRASSKYFGECQSWPSRLQTWRPLVGEILTLEREEGNSHDKFAVSLLKDATVVGHVPPEFSRVFGIGSFCCRSSSLQSSVSLLLCSFVAS